MIQISDNWRSSHPGGAVGLLSVEIDRSQTRKPDLDQERISLENQLREKYGGVPRTEIRQLPLMQDYTQYYKRFKKSYHVLLQARFDLQQEAIYPPLRCPGAGHVHGGDEKLHPDRGT